MVAAGPIIELARDLGFELAGVCDTGAPRSIDAYRDWLAQGMAGEMAYLAKHADLRADPASLLDGVKSIIAVGLPYNQPAPKHPGYPRIARYALGRDYHKVIRGKLRRLMAWLASEHPDAEFRICVDSAPILEREFAQRAGLGWFGKNTMLIDSRRGSWFLIGLLLTTLEIEPSQPAEGGCGTCTACIDACPTGAIVWLEKGGRWAVDARRCISYLTIEKPEEADSRIGDWTFGCDVCQEVCPFNAPRESQPLRARPTRIADFLEHSPIVSMRLDEVARMSRDDWDLATRGSPIRRAGYEGLRRVARINQSERSS